VKFICGSDTHGTPIVIEAEKQNIHPKKFFMKYHEHFKYVFDRLHVKFDYYGHTDMSVNHDRTRQIVQELIDKGYIYSREIELSFCEKCNRFLPDRFVRGTCPYCGMLSRGDECDQGCRRYLDPGEILNPRFSSRG
jgi:methionyl-tRNA synthetase